MDSRVDVRLINVRVKSLEEPFQATRIWNEIIYSFCAGVPLKTYRRRFKTYKHCFMACKAIDWLLEYLQTSGNAKNVSRQSTVKLLRKFVTCGIIERASGKECGSEFRDNKDLYQLKGKV